MQSDGLDKSSSDISDKTPTKSLRTIDQLGDRMKAYEEKSYVTKHLDHSQPFIARLDGHTFHTYTRGFQRPFDENLHRAMVLSTQDLVNRYHARCGYTQSDEITLVFAAARSGNTEEKSTDNSDVTDKQATKKIDQVHLFGGRAVKISTVLAGYCSARFNYHIMMMAMDGKFDDEQVYLPLIKERAMGGTAHFDARSFNVPNAAEVLNNVIWRSHFDCVRNSISALARKHYSANEMHGKGKKDLLKMLKQEKGVDWETDTPMAFRYGTFVKKELYDMEYIVHGTDNEKANTKRTRTVSMPIKIDKFEHKYMDMLLDKYWAKQWL